MATQKPAKKRTATRAMDPSFAPVAAAFARKKDVTSGFLMSSFGLKTKNKIFAMSWRKQLVVKLPRERVDALVAARAGKRFDPGHGRPMKEWIVIAEGGGDWPALAREAYAYVSAAS